MTKLDQAAEDIKVILNKYDIAGMVILHYPGKSKSLLKLDPSYSVCRLEDNKLKIRARLEDFKGDKAKRNKKLADTNNMLKLLCEVGIDTIYSIYDPSDKFDKKLQEENLGPYA